MKNPFYFQDLWLIFLLIALLKATHSFIFQNSIPSPFFYEKVYLKVFFSFLILTENKLEYNLPPSNFLCLDNLFYIAEYFYIISISQGRYNYNWLAFFCRVAQL